MSDELVVKKAAVLEAAKTCPQAREILEAIFPDAFAPTLEEVLQGVVDINLAVRAKSFHLQNIPTSIWRNRTWNLNYTSMMLVEALRFCCRFADEKPNEQQWDEFFSTFRKAYGR